MSIKNVIGIYANGSQKIGMGHIYRTMAIGDELKLRGYIVEYICTNSDEESINYLRSRNYSVKETTFINNVDILYDTLIIDSYDINSLNIQEFYNFADKILFIDDLHNMKIYDMDLVLNYAIGSEKLKYNGNAKKLLGTLFTPLRKEFTAISYNKPNEVVKNIMITMGGGDFNNITKKILNNLNLRYNSLNFHVVLGKLYPYKGIIQSEYILENVKFYIDIENISNLMKKCDIAISAGGSTLYELCSCGVPTIAVITADNQLQSVERLNNMIELPYVDAIKHTDYNEKINKILNSMLEDYSLRCSLSKKMNNLIDGNGVKRIVNEIENLEKKL